LGFDTIQNENPLSPIAKIVLRSLDGPNSYEFVENKPFDYYDPNGLWVSRYPENLRTPIGGLGSVIAGTLGGILMNHCPDLTCHSGTCKACCTAGFAAATLANGAGAAVGCGGTLGWGCWINIGIAAVAEIGLADTYNQCLKSCDSKPH
jgi:hypothetical protein